MLESRSEKIKDVRVLLGLVQDGVFRADTKAVFKITYCSESSVLKLRFLPFPS